MTAKIDLMGQRFGKLVVVKDAGRTKDERVIWLCQCDCGKLAYIHSKSIRDKHTKSCGCLQREWARHHIRAMTFLHGDALKKEPPYNSWIDMIKRCNNPKHKAYHRYGGRGISVCEEWLDYPIFKKWAVANGHEKGLSIDRIDNDGNYYPENCQWITRVENVKKYWREWRAKKEEK